MPGTGTETALAARRPTTATVLIVDDEDATRSLCRDVVGESGLRTRTASTTEQALEILEQSPVDVIITDLRVPQLGGIELLKRVRESHPQIAVIVLTQYGTIESAVEATRMGAADYVTKPFHVPELRTKLDRVLHSLELDQENRILREQLRSRPGFGGLIGVSPKMQRVYRLVEKVSQHKYPVLILGESGTGKELVADAIAGKDREPHGDCVFQTAASRFHQMSFSDEIHLCPPQSLHNPYQVRLFLKSSCFRVLRPRRSEAHLSGFPVRYKMKPSFPE